MANRKKPRAPTPPRRVQAPRPRTDGGRGAISMAGVGARQRTLLYAIAGAGVLALVAVVGAIALGGSGTSGKEAAKALVAAGCTYRHYPAQPRAPHYATLTPNPPPKWNSFPPSSGRHYSQPVLWGDYTEPVRLIQEVHNLEHGGMIIQYGDKVPRADIAKIDAFWQEDPTAMLVAPLPKLGNKIALTAWTQWAECTRFDQNAFKKFQSAFRFHAPESPVFPKSSLQPGM